MPAEGGNPEAAQRSINNIKFIGDAPDHRHGNRFFTMKYNPVA